jgi:hypothetical protein
MRRAAKIDGNQRAIVAALRKIGARVLHLHAVGGGCPDLLVCYRGRNVLLEVKRPGEKPNPLQIEFHALWGGEIYIVHSPAEAVDALRYGNTPRTRLDARGATHGKATVPEVMPQ